MSGLHIPTGIPLGISELCQLDLTEWDSKTGPGARVALANGLSFYECHVLNYGRTTYTGQGYTAAGEKNKRVRM